MLEHIFAYKTCYLLFVYRINPIYLTKFNIRNQKNKKNVFFASYKAMIAFAN
jgi:hypothetical protein